MYIPILEFQSPCLAKGSRHLLPSLQKLLWVVVQTHIQTHILLVQALTVWIHFD